MSIANKNLRGGGVINSFNPTTPKNPTKALGFKPLIATSLALALGVSVMYAQENGNSTPISSGNIIINKGEQTGDIIMVHNNQNNFSVTFKTGTSLHADITRDGNMYDPNAGNVTVNFNNGSTMVGNIKTGVAEEGNDFSSNIVTFSDASNVEDIVLTGNIYSGGARSDNDGNHVTFTNGSMRGDIITEIKYYGGYNSVTFSQNGAKLEGNINSSGGVWGDSKNIVNFTLDGIITGRVYSAIGNNKVTIGGNATITNGVQTSTDGYSSYNTVIISGNGISTIGDVLVTGNYNTNSKNIIQAENASKLVLNTLKADNGKILKDQTRSGNINEIKLGNGTLEIESGGVYASNGGNNIINAGSLELQGTDGDIVIGNGGYNSYNTITLTGGASVGKIETNGNANTQSTNTITTNGNLVISKSVIAKNGDKSSGKRGNENIITVNGGALGINTSKIPSHPHDISSIADDASNIAVLADVGTNTIKANANALILGQINAVNGGTNNIYIKDPNSPIANPNFIGSINSNGGTNNIIFDGGFWLPNSVTKENGSPSDKPQYGNSQSGKLVTSNGGTSNIIFRQGAANPLGTDVAYFTIKHSGSGESNIVMQSNTTAQHINVKMSLNYGSEGKVNAIFSSGNSMTQSSDEDFSNKTNSDTDTFFGIQYTNGVKLTLTDKKIDIGNTKEASLVNTYSSLYRDQDGSLVKIASNRDASGQRDTITIEGLAIGKVDALDGGQANWNYDVTMKGGSAFAGSITLDPTSKVQLVLDYDKQNNNGAKFIVTDEITKLKTLKIVAGKVNIGELQKETLAQANTVINLATGGASAINAGTRTKFRLLEVGDNSKTADTGLIGQGAALFVNYINANADQTVATLGGKRNAETDSYGYAYADRILIHNRGDNTASSTSQFYMQLAVDKDTQLSTIKYVDGGTKTENNIAVATIAKKNGATSGSGSEAEIRNMGIIKLQETDVVQGFDQIGGTFKTVETDATGNSNATQKGYVTYFVNHMETKGASETTQNVSASAVATNYDLYIANFNSLNKRMGELRDNNHSQGAWARVFNGSQTNSSDFGSTTNYTTIQAGYDYAFGFEGTNNYVGLAIAYSMSSSKGSTGYNNIGSRVEGIQDIKSNLVEVAIYNSYVQDEGWYNDSIFKFSYIMSDFTLTLGSDTQSTSNMAYTFSDEFGYRFKLGEAKEWYIDPQLELGFGYFDQTDFVQKLGDASLDTKANSLMTVRARVGSSFGYDFKQFTEGKGVDAKLYAGVFYEYDYITGGELNLKTNLGGTNTLNSALSSDGRVVMNVGTNVTVQDSTRIYFDFEKSFAGKITTDYQVNVGVRYSFGENTGYTPANTAKVETAPLKIDENKAQEETEDKEQTTENTVSEENKTQEIAQ
ncbi:autotransporter outer membrane beta-barrel domain-containing protein [uncultured Helicobacter sp.]|uniref:autotransporter outer membrane beta-barrel domain-containing protein n=1 Tax=uncultured Helicobacter sp. TaxID=175537 RepID=UPI00261F06C9|nr:autotransporter outer membrane beta-barrel domain-containing protein [uncultured Helicobacter sp.]